MAPLPGPLPASQGEGVFTSRCAAGRRACLALLLLTSSAFAQIVPEREVEIVQSLYDVGQYANVIKRVDESLSLANFSDAQRIKLLELRALSSFNSGDAPGTKSDFLSLLKLNPDYILDPFAVPPPVIKLFDQVKKENVDTLNLVRQQIALRAEQEKRAAAERERLAREAEAKRRLEEGMVTVRTIERRSMLANFLPFGAGQFAQGRLGVGAAFAVTEGIMAILSVVSFYAIEGLFQTRTIELWDRVRPEGEEDTPYIITQRSIPASRRTERDVWTGLKYATGVAFFALWGVGVGEAIWHHESETITEQQVPLKSLKPQARLRFFPAPGGFGAGLTVSF